MHRLTFKEQVSRLIILGFLLGCFFQYMFVKRFLALLSHRKQPRQPFANFHISTHDNYHKSHAFSYAFTFATGRSGTQHLSRVLRSSLSPQAYITHEQEHLNMRTKLIVHRHYRPLASLPDEAHFNVSADYYIRHTKIPFYESLLRQQNATRLVYTGHVPTAFGLAPSLIRNLPKGCVRFLRIRRDRIATAVSLMALGPEQQDPWGSTSNDTNSLTKADQVASVDTRWFPRPSDALVRLQVPVRTWASLNRFQRWLWYVDDVECRWQALRDDMSHDFSWMEEALENLSAMDGGRAWRRMAEFIGVDVNWRQVAMRDNSIQYKNRLKTDASEAQLREWDAEYRKMVGACVISNSKSYSWKEFPLELL